MSLGTNLQFLRKKVGMTQEELAEKMEVSRQTVSKWEADGAFPEMEKLVTLCELFSCTMDDLVRGDIVTEYTEADREYDSHMNRFSIAIAGGVALVLFGLTLLILLSGFSVPDVLCVILLLLFVTAAVTIFILSGITHSDFIRENPHIGKIYEERVIRSFDRKFPALIAVPVATILIGVIWLIAAEYLPHGSLAQETWESVYASVFFLILTGAVPVFVWAGLQKSKYNIDEYNRSAEKEHSADKKEEAIASKISSVIMLIATASYLFIGFVFQLWHPGWVVFPTGGILCGIFYCIFPE